MDNFDIQGNTNSELAQDVQKSTIEYEQPASSHENVTYDKPKVYDSFDPFNCALTVGFKIIAVTLYLVLKMAVDSYLGTFITTVLLLSIDFWVTKNLTARKLVGLRWWSQLTEEGEQQWIFESRSPNREPHGANVSIFWVGQLICLAFWMVIFIINIFTISLFWIGLALFASLLSLVNFVCFFKCRGEHQSKAQEWGKKFGMKNTSNMF